MKTRNALKLDQNAFLRPPVILILEIHCGESEFCFNVQRSFTTVVLRPKMHALSVTRKFERISEPPHRKLAFTNVYQT